MRWLLAILMLNASLFAAPPTWTPANFHGLTLGRAHREDALRTLGTPDADSRTSNGEELLYKTRGSHKGDLTVRLDRSGIVTEIQESLPVAIPRTKLYQEFGKDALTAHYSRAKCAGRCVLSRPARCHRTHALSVARRRSLARSVRLRLRRRSVCCQAPGLDRPPACVSRH